MLSKKLTLLVSGVALLATGCTFPSSRRVIPARQANVMQTVDTGVVTSVRMVNIEGRQTGIGVVGGGLVGGAAARPSRGNHSTAGALGQAGGVIVGAVVGAAVEEAATRTTAQEIVIRLDDGRNVTVTQTASTGVFKDGDRVRVMHGGGGARVAMDTGS